MIELFKHSQSPLEIRRIRLRLERCFVDYRGAFHFLSRRHEVRHCFPGWNRRTVRFATTPGSSEHLRNGLRSKVCAIARFQSISDIAKSNSPLRCWIFVSQVGEAISASTKPRPTVLISRLKCHLRRRAAFSASGKQDFNAATPLSCRNSCPRKIRWRFLWV